MKLSNYIVCLSLLTTTFAHAEDELTMEQVSAVSKIAGSCGQMKGQLIFQTQTELEGGDKLFVRYWTTEAARLGLSFNEYSEMCVSMLKKYADLKELIVEEK